mgnify:CR=1 FL=1
MWLGACTSTIGTWMQKAAQSWLVYSLSNSKFLLSLDSFLGEIPILLLSLFGGVASDRFDRRKLLMASQFGQMTTALILAVLFATGKVQIWHILLLSFFTGCVQAFGGPAYQALLPMMVPKEAIQNAIAMNSIQFNIARLIGPALGGLALTQLGAAWCFGLNGLSFLAVIFALSMMSPKFGGGNAQESVLASMRKGVDFVRHREGMGALIVIAFAMTALGLPMMVFLPVVAKEVFQQTATGFTIMLSVSGAGSIVGGLLVAYFSQLRHKGRAALANLALLGLLIALFGLSTNIWLSYAAIFFASTALIASFALIASLVQNQTTDDMRGRVMSVYNVAFRGGGPIGALLCGELAELSSTAHVLAGCGILLALLALWFLFVHRRVAAL